MSESRNQILIIGGGAMGRAIAYELTHYEPVLNVIVLDSSRENLERLTDLTGTQRVVTVMGFADDTRLLSQLMSECRVAVGAISYTLNRRLMELAIHCGASWVDLGGNSQVVAEQFKLGEAANRSEVTAVPDAGLAPGMVNIIGGDAFNRLERVRELHFRVGGLPVHPQPPLFYGLVFSAEGLINEYIEPADIIKDGRRLSVPSLTGWERVVVGPPLGTLEAFHTSGGASTMVETLAGRVEALDYKTLRYPGHLARMNLLKDVGLFAAEPLKSSNIPSVVPRQVIQALLEAGGRIQDDLVVMKSWAVGSRGGRPLRVDYTLLDYADPATNLTAMARTTGFSAAVVVRMIMDGRIAQVGVLHQEFAVPPAEFFKELNERGIRITVGEDAV